MANVNQISVNALRDFAYTNMTLEDYAYALDNEPESVVFYPGDGEPWDDDDMEAIKIVGANDVYAKLVYWQEVVSDI